jgi:hypothetical protein
MMSEACSCRQLVTCDAARRAGWTLRHQGAPHGVHACNTAEARSSHSRVTTGLHQLNSWQNKQEPGRWPIDAAEEAQGVSPCPPRPEFYIRSVVTPRRHTISVAIVARQAVWRGGCSSVSPSRRPRLRVPRRMGRWRRGETGAIVLPCPVPSTRLLHAAAELNAR